MRWGLKHGIYQFVISELVPPKQSASTGYRTMFTFFEKCNWPTVSPTLIPPPTLRPISSRNYNCRLWRPKNGCLFVSWKKTRTHYQHDKQTGRNKNVILDRTQNSLHETTTKKSWKMQTMAASSSSGYNNPRSIARDKWTTPPPPRQHHHQHHHHQHHHHHRHRFGKGGQPKRLPATTHCTAPSVPLHCWHISDWVSLNNLLWKTVGGWNQ